ncbi:uncharacterized protein JCM15063_002598 [Sporobolomyces koalae]|uniref:uncharacterized protein n=1 Tax=Sporobolomyces koalae TaxID=500713 RepID=UPI0031823FB2
MWTAPSQHKHFYFDGSADEADVHESPSRPSDDSIEVLSTGVTPRAPRRPAFLSHPSSASSASTSSSASEVDFSGPFRSPFFSAPSRPCPAFEKENVSPITQLAPSTMPNPRPTAPLPALPLETPVAAKHLRGPSNTVTHLSTEPYRAPPLTGHNSLASFEAAHSKPATSEDSHRTSSDVDLDLSFDYDARNDIGGHAFSDEQSQSSRSGRSIDSTREDSSGNEGILEKLEKEVMQGGWVGIQMTQSHDIPEGQLVRSESGKLVGARASKARSALDLRAQFKAAELERLAQEQQAREQDVSIVVMEEMDNVLDDAACEEAKRREIRAGKRPVEGERAGWVRGQPIDKVQRRRSAGWGFAYNTTGSLAAPRALPQPPHSAPLVSAPVFESQQQQRPAHQIVDLSPFSAELDQAKRQKAFPLPLRLIDRSVKAPAGAVASASSPRIGSRAGTRSSRQSVLYYESDTASSEPSPLFDHLHGTDDEEGAGTNRTAPSTPNDTPLFQECFSDDEMDRPPVPDKDGALAGLGFDFEIAGSPPSPLARDEFPTVPLRRRSLPPNASLSTRRMSNRQHMPIPSLSISPPPRHAGNPLEDIFETDSSQSSHDSAVDPTVSPSRRISRRLSASNPGLAHIGPTITNRRQSVIASSGVQPSSPRHGHAATSTPTNERGATIITPQHLLVTPSDAGQGATPSFSFSPAPLRLVKAQLLRAAGYKYEHVGTSSPPLESTISSPVLESFHATSSPRKKPATPQPQRERQADPVVPAGSKLRRRNRVGTTLDELSDLLSSSAETWIDEVIPAKLAFIAGFLLGPWFWIIGGWYLRPHDGELPGSRGQRCRIPTCNCGRILRGSTSRQQAQHSTTKRTGEGRARERSEDDWAGLDKWVFGNRVAACGGGVGIAVLVGVAIWAAASA